MENYCFGVKWKANGDPDLPMSNSMRSAVAAFARQTSNATFTNMKFNKMTLLGNAGIATISVQDENSTFENIVIEIYIYIVDIMVIEWRQWYLQKWWKYKKLLFTRRVTCKRK